MTGRDEDSPKAPAVEPTGDRRGAGAPEGVDPAGGADATGRAAPPRRRGVRRPPDQTSDDTDAAWGERRDEDAHDRWLQEQRPPHWE